MLACGELFSSMGWDCSPIKAKGITAIHVGTPFCVGRTKPLGFFAIEHGSALELTDDGTVMQALRVAGHQLEGPKHWRPLEGFATSLGIRLDDSGAFLLTASPATLRDAAARWLQLYSAIVAWDSERLAVDDADPGLEDEIRQVLAQVDALRELVDGPAVEIRGGTQRFSFRWGNVFVDACSAHATATNSRLRKALLLKQIDPGAQVLVVVDDRKSIDRADRETIVLNTVVQATALRNLRLAATEFAA